MTGPDARVQDALALAEIELYGELVVAATESDGPLPTDRIDAILGVQHAQVSQRVG